MVHLIRHYYRERDFCVITPYDAQRAAIQKRLQAELLPHDRVFNVDSFQGWHITGTSRFTMLTRLIRRS